MIRIFLMALLLCTGCQKGTDHPKFSWTDLSFNTESQTDCPLAPAWSMALAFLDVTHLPPAQAHTLASCETQDDLATVRAAARLGFTSPDGVRKVQQGFGLQTCQACQEAQVFWTATRAMHSALTEAARQLTIEKESDEALISIIQHPDKETPPVVLAALEEIAQRQLDEAVPGCIALLDHRDHKIVLRSIGTLGRLHNPAALRPLGKMALSPAQQIPYAALTAIADIGGIQAQSVLQLVSDQAGDSFVGEEAARLIREIEDAEP